MAKRWVATDFGGLDVLELVDATVPDPGPGEVTIAVRAAGMNPANYKRFAKGPNNARRRYRSRSVSRCPG